VELPGTYAEEAVVTIDGKTLRGIRRDRETALQVVTTAGQDWKKALAQSQVQIRGWVATVKTLSTLSLQRKVVTLDAGLLQLSVAQTAVENMD